MDPALAAQMAKLAFLRALQMKVDDIKEQIKYVAVFAACAIIILGVVGNILALIIFLRKSLRNTSSGTYFTSIITIDFLLILLGAVPDLAFISIEEDMGVKVGAWFCKCWTFAFRTLQGLSSWVTLAAAVDTFLLLQRPDRSATRNTVSKARGTLACLALTTMGLNLWVFWGVDALGQNAVTGTIQYTQCGYSSVKFLNFDVNDNQYIFLVLFSAFPTFGLIVLSMPIIFKCLKLHIVVIDPSPAQRATLSSALILASSFTFILMEAPNIAMGSVFWSEVLVPYTRDPIELLWRLFVKGILIFFGYAHHSIKFFVYCVISPAFRQDVKNICNNNVVFTKTISVNGNNAPLSNKADCEEADGESGTLKKDTSGEGMAKY